MRDTLHFGKTAASLSVSYIDPGIKGISSVHFSPVRPPLPFSEHNHIPPDNVYVVKIPDSSGNTLDK
jgi:hypothetical protein